MPETNEVAARTAEALEKPGQDRLAGNAFDAEQLRQQRVAPQIGDVRDFFGPAEQALHEAQHLAHRRQRVIRLGQRMRQTARQQFDPAALAQEGPERGRARVGTEPLVGETDLDGLARALELNVPSHRLVNRACARRLRCFHLPPISS